MFSHATELNPQLSHSSLFTMVLLRRTAPPLLRSFSKSLTARLTTSTTPNPSSSVDPSEVSHFNALASSWWDPHGPSRLLHLMNPLRHSFLHRCLASSNSIPHPSPHPSSASTTGTLHLLDIGCGGGIFAESAARLPTTASVTAIDPSPEVLKVAEAHKRRDPALVAGGKLTYLNMGIEDLARQSSDTAESTVAGKSTSGGKYDVVTIFEVLEHVSHPSTFLTQVLPHVKPGGWIVISTIARTWASWVVTKLVAEDIVGIVPRGTHEWSKYINEEELRAWFDAREGWGSPRAMGVVYVPGLGWREVPGSEGVGNYFFAVKKMPE